MSDEEKKKTRNLDAKQFEELIKGDKPVFVDFFATWCGPCQMMLPIIDEWASEHGEKDYIVAKLDIDQAPEIAAKHNVMGVPTFIIFKGGKEIERMQGVMPKESLAEAMEKVTK